MSRGSIMAHAMRHASEASKHHDSDHGHVVFVRIGGQTGRLPLRKDCLVKTRDACAG